MEGKTVRTPNFKISVSTRLVRLAKLATEAPDVAFTTLAHHIDIKWLERAFRRTCKDGAAGVDRATAAAYAIKLRSNLKSLLDRVKLGTYRAPPVRQFISRRAAAQKRDGSVSQRLRIRFSNARSRCC